MAESDILGLIGKIDAYRSSQCIMAAVELGLFDALESGINKLGPLAHSLHCDQSALLRLLHGCCSLGLVDKKDETYANAALARRWLTTTSIDSIVAYVRYSTIVSYPLWAHLYDAVREGSNRWAQEFNTTPDLYSSFYSGEEMTSAVIHTMACLGKITSPMIIKAFDLSAFRLMVDLGGSTGHLAVEACKAYPSLHAIVLDRAEVFPEAQRAVESAGLADRVEVRCGDLFSDQLPGGDLYALGRIIHDWPQPRVEKLLSRLYDSLPHQGGLLVAERLLDEDRVMPAQCSLQNLNMLVCTEGQERTEQEYRALLGQAGFKSMSFVRTGSLLDAVLARRQ